MGISPQVIRTDTRRHSEWWQQLLEGKNVNLRVMEKEDLPMFVEWVNEPEFLGEYNGLMQLSKLERENA